jgi:hypothetical protein
MRLEEFQSQAELSHTLASKGFDYLGHGNFTRVFAKPDATSVIRVGDGSDSWLVFANLCRQSNNPHFPKITRLGFRSDGTENGKRILVAVVERLIPLKLDSHAFTIRYTPIVAYILAAVSPDWWGKANWIYGNLCLVAQQRDQINRRDAAALHAWVAAEAKQIEPAMKAALDSISNLSGVNFDFSPDNFMRRADGTLVITDPVW